MCVLSKALFQRLLSVTDVMPCRAKIHTMQNKMWLFYSLFINEPVYGTLIFQLLLWAYVGLVYIDFDLPDRPQYPAQRPFHKNVETDHLIRPSRETV
jgi:hypothetical protein